MSKLNEHAKTLRSVAQSLEDRAKSIPVPTAKQIMGKHAGSYLTCRVQVPLYPLMDKTFDIREYVTRDIGNRLGREFAKVLTPTYVSSPWQNGIYDHACYEAQAYIFTPAQLEALINNAIKETRQQ